MTGLEILTTGPLALVEDLGRPGLAHIGVTRSGAADRRAHALANRLLANPPEAATVEITLGGFSARFHGGPFRIAVTGADARPTLDGIPFGLNSIQQVQDGQVLTLQTPPAGLRSYLGVRGGIDATPVLGSRSSDTLSGLGPPPLRPGDALSVGPVSADFPDLDQAPVAPITGDPVVLRVVRGPREGWFTDPDALVLTEWTVSPHSNRVGVRLSGPGIEHRTPGEQPPSEGATRGTVQVPPNGQPVILGPDHPVTGGYPVIGVVVDADNDAVAQLRPGQTVRLRWNQQR